MAEIKRVIWIVLDSVGIGELPDADKFGDVGSNTLCNTAKAVGGLKIPNMVQLGIGNIAGITGIEKCEQPKGCYGRLAEISNGKDTTIGHWEMTGIYSPDPFPVYPDGFPQEVIEPFIKKPEFPEFLEIFRHREQRLLNSWVRNISAPENPSSIHRVILFFRLQHMKM